MSSDRTAEVDTSLCGRIDGILFRHGVGVRTFADAGKRYGVGEVARGKVRGRAHLLDVMRAKVERERVARTDVKNVLITQAIGPSQCRCVGVGAGADNNFHGADLLSAGHRQ